MKLFVPAKLFTVLGFFLVICFSLFVLFTPHIIWGATCERKDSASQEELQSIIDACSKQVNELGQQRDTLTKQIQYMDSQIYLTELNVQENQQSIEKIQEEIESLGERIGELNSTLTQVSETTTDKIRIMYKRQRHNPMFTALVSNDITTLLRSVQYLKRTQENDRNIILRLQNTKTNFNEKKSLREEKEVELNTLNDQLASYKISLAQQQRGKEDLLAVTKNDAVKYQQLLSQAKAQISAFKQFTQSVGATGTISADGLGKGYDGSYFSQRDERWGFATIGNSSMTIRDVGCLVTSVSMALKSKGVDVTPLTIASNSSYFFDADMQYRNELSLPGGHTGQWINKNDIDNYLVQEQAVIVGLNIYGGSYPNHFVVLKKKDGDSWIMFDPIYGPDLKFTDHYSTGQIFSAEIII